jgi:flagellar hook assembly protein FlgD
LVKFTVHDLLGREIYSEHRNLLSGNYSFTWDGQNNLEQQVVSGVYFLKMEADGFAQTRKMLMMK